MGKAFTLCNSNLANMVFIYPLQRQNQNPAMESFMKIGDGFHTLIIFAKYSVLDLESDRFRIHFCNGFADSPDKTEKNKDR